MSNNIIKGLFLIVLVLVGIGVGFGADTVKYDSVQIGDKTLNKGESGLIEINGIGYSFQLTNEGSLQYTLNPENKISYTYITPEKIKSDLGEITISTTESSSVKTIDTVPNAVTATAEIKVGKEEAQTAYQQCANGKKTCNLPSSLEAREGKIYLKGTNIEITADDFSAFMTITPAGSSTTISGSVDTNTINTYINTLKSLNAAQLTVIEPKALNGDINTRLAYASVDKTAKITVTLDEVKANIDTISKMYSKLGNNVREEIMTKTLSIITNSNAVDVKKDDVISKLCSANSGRCGEDIKSILTSDVNINAIKGDKENLDSLFKYLTTAIASNTIEMTKAQAAYIIANSPAIDRTKQEEFTKAINGGTDCNNGMFGSVLKGWGCAIVGKETTKELYLEGLSAKFDEIETKSYVMPTKEIKVGKVTINCNRKPQSECEAQIKTACKKSTSCEKEAIATMNREKTIDVSKANEGIWKALSSSMAATSGERSNCDSYDDCKKEVDEYCEKGDSDTCSALRAGLERADDQTYVHENPWSPILQGLINPDQDALKAAKLLFGEEADYSHLGRFGQEYGGICLYKIDGYLDKNEAVNKYKYGNGQTSYYSCDEESINSTDRSVGKCLEVFGDLRARRAAITPDNHTVITIDYYLKKMEYVDTYYAAAVAYKQKGVVVKKLLIAPTNITANTKQYKNFNLYLNQTDGLVENSFQIAVATFKRGTKNKEMVLQTPVYLATADVYNVTNYYSDSDGSSVSANTIEIDADDIIDLFS